MPFFSREHIEYALIYLGENTHPALTSFLALLRENPPASADDADCVRFGGPVENRFLTDYFSPAGAPEGSPFYIPFGSQSGLSRWRDEKYSGRSLQRQRKERPRVFHQSEADNNRWSFAPGYVEWIVHNARRVVGNIPISILCLAIWSYRKADVGTLDAAIQRFIEEFHLQRDGLMGHIFDDVVPDRLAALELVDNPLSDEELLTVLEHVQDNVAAEEVQEDEVPPVRARLAAPEEAPGSWDLQPADFGTLGGLIGVKEAAVRAVAALRAGQHVIFTGPPGTGKTTLAEFVCRRAGFSSWTVPATDQWTTFETIGGYFPVPDGNAGEADRLDFLPGAVVDAIEKGRCLIVDEINRADIDKAFGELFTLLAGSSVTLPYRRRSAEGLRRVRLQVGPGMVEECVDVVSVPTWWRMIGAMNDADKASLKRLSLAFIRRFAFIPVELPAAADYRLLLEQQAGDAPAGVPQTHWAHLRNVFIELFADRGAGLGGIGLPLGPAIPLSMLRHARSEWHLDPARDVAELLRSVFELYLIPQMQGRSDIHAPIVALLNRYVREEDRERLGRHLAVWTGFVAE